MAESPSQRDLPATAPDSVLIDFGGVLTSSVLDSFRRGSEEMCGDRELFLRVLRDDEEARRLLVEHECGRLDAAEFERDLAARLHVHGAVVSPTGLTDRLQAGLEPNQRMLRALAGMRAAGVPVAIVSNSFGHDTYRGYDLDQLADVVVISGAEGVRKPSRRLYALACERLERDPTDCVMVDDLKHNLDGAARLGIRGIHHVDTAETLLALEALLGISLSD